MSAPRALQRSEHVMWIGNVPNNTTTAELMQFLSQMPAGGSGIMSIFIIAKSNCAFVNFSTDEHVSRAVKTFSGMSIRPHDPRWPPLICRPRKKEEEAQAGVAGQRGKGLHRAYYNDFLRKTQEGRLSDRATGTLESLDDVSVSLHGIDGQIGEAIGASPRPVLDGTTSTHHGQLSPIHGKESTSLSSVSTNESSTQDQASLASTNSSLLAHAAFANRFFILKARTTRDLDICVQSGVWDLQDHNREVLAQAHRNSEAVYLIFSANGSGAFFGYAKLLGPAADSSEPQSSSPPATVNATTEDSSPFSPTESNSAGRRAPNTILKSPERVSKAESPPLVALSKSQNVVSASKSLETQSVVHNLRLNERKTQGKAEELRQPPVEDQLQLSTSALPVSAADDSLSLADGSSGLSKDHVDHSIVPSPNQSHCTHDHTIHGIGPDTTTPPRSHKQLSNMIRVEWLQTASLPFSAVKHMRNPWNDNKSLRVARDGTEIAVDVGKELLLLWEKYISSSGSSCQRDRASQ